MHRRRAKHGRIAAQRRAGAGPREGSRARLEWRFGASCLGTPWRTSSSPRRTSRADA